MIVKSITLDFFRNYPHLETSFSPDVNVICGENAQGKTNLLEAIGYLSTASSRRARYDRELIQFGVDHAFVKAEVFSRERDLAAVQRREAENRRGAGGGAQYRVLLPGGFDAHPGGGGGAPPVPG